MCQTLCYDQAGVQGQKGSKTLFRVLEFPGKIPKIKRKSSEKFNLCEAEIFLDEDIKLS